MVTLLTYNVLEGATPDRLDAVVRVIESAGADLVAIQEARYWRRHRRGLLRQVSRALGLRALLAPANSGFDLVLFTRLPVLAWENLGADTPFLHTALSATVRTPAGADLTLFVVHLRPDLPGRRHEAELVREWSRGCRRAYAAMCGDLNSLTPGDPLARYAIRPGSPLGRRPDSVVTSLLRDGWRDCFRLAHPHLAGFTLGEHRRVARVDYILASKPLAEKLVACRVHRTPEALQASDHSPVWAQFDL